MATNETVYNDPVLAIQHYKEGDIFSQTLDLDALFGHMPYDIFKKSFKKNICIEVDNSARRAFIKKNKIKTQYMIQLDPLRSEKTKIKSLPHVRLGSCKTTDFGPMEIFLVLTKTNLTSAELKSIVYENLFRIMRKNSDDAVSCHNSNHSDINKKELDIDGKELLCEFTKKDFCKVFKDLFDNNLMDDGPIFYFETFGNKTSTTIKSMKYKKIVKKIKLTFRKSGFSYITLDICISSSFGKNTVTVAKRSLFEEAQLEPNFKPLMSETMLNYNNSTTDPKTGSSVRTGIFDKLFKINFYCTFAYDFNFDKSKSYAFSICRSLFLNNFHDHRIFSNKDKLKNLVRGYKRVRHNAKHRVDDNKCRYRNEVRCKLLDLKHVMNQLKPLVKPENFSYYNGKVFYEILQKNVNLFLNEITDKSHLARLTVHDSMAYSALSEFIFKTIYINGGSYGSALPKIVREAFKRDIRISRNSVALLIHVKTVIKNIFNNIITIPEKHDLVLKQVKYMFMKKERRGPLVEQLVDISYNLDSYNEEQFIGKIFEVYMRGKTDDPDCSITELKNQVPTEETITAPRAMKTIFSHPRPENKSSPAKVVFGMFKKKFGITDETVGLKKLSDYLKSKGVRMIYKYISYKKMEKVHLDYKKPPVEEKVESDADKRLKKLKAYVDSSKVNSSNAKGFAEEEVIRFLSAMFMHSFSTKRADRALNDFAYGFIPIRNANWFRNKFKGLKKVWLKDEKTFNRIITKVKEWTPDNFTMRNRITYFEKHNRSMKNKELKKYKELMALDVDSWWANTEIRNKLYSSTSEFIVLAITKDDKQYRKLKTRIAKWKPKKITIVAPTRKKSKTVTVVDIKASSECEILNEIETETYSLEESIEVVPTRPLILTELRSKSLKTIRSASSTPTKVDRLSMQRPKIVLKNFTRSGNSIYLNLNSDISEPTRMYDNMNDLNLKSGLTEIVTKLKMEAAPNKEIIKLSYDQSNEIKASSEVELTVKRISETANISLVNNYTEQFDDFEADDYTPETATLQSSAKESAEICTDVVVKSSYLTNPFMSTPQSAMLSQPEKCLVTTIEDSRNEKLKKYHTALFNEYRYRVFDMTRAKRKFNNVLQMPSKQEWSHFVEKYVTNNIISRSLDNKQYRFNLNSSANNNRFLKFSKVQNVLNKHLKLAQGHQSTACKLRTYITLDLRPTPEDWENFLNDLVDDKLLSVKTQDSTTYYFMTD